MTKWSIKWKYASISGTFGRRNMPMFRIMHTGCFFNEVTCLNRPKIKSSNRFFTKLSGIFLELVCLHKNLTWLDVSIYFLRINWNAQCSKMSCLYGGYRDLGWDDNTYNYAFLYCERTNYDEITNEPNLESRMIGQTLNNEIFVKFGLFMEPHNDYPHF